LKDLLIMKDTMNRILRRFNCEVHGLGYLAKLAKGEFKKDGYQQQKELFTGKPVRVIFDVGANWGGISRQYRSLFPEAKILSFEPLPDIYKVLVETSISDSNIIPYNTAISNKTGHETLYVNRNVDSSSLLASKLTGTGTDKQTATVREITVATITIDEICKKQGITAIDILKLDIQGGELKALAGASKLLAEKKIALIYTEVSFFSAYKNSPLFHDIAQYLYSFGYQLGDLYDPFYTSRYLVQADALFLSSQFM